ncbi:molecular chaperone DnaJ [Oceanicola sp. 22II-s10i]|uniref:DnaJ family domain-containing protein n=1 Tax=Oceanicola sp. 22II-s10i TaxID=1317116 RepID=UPI000B5266BC|nr:DnaJ family domain-containing protein [Oceanicola sp. 22II-s10i]OWU83929.1 molecular chaperone DnaJ [Oceanicola sp. 22II-s10i]
MTWLTRRVERMLLKAGAEGKLQGLRGEGKPLPDRPEESMVDAGTAAGMRIMAEAGALPEEFAIKKQLDAARAAYAALPDNAPERQQAMSRIAALEMRYNIARESRQRFMRD